MSDEALRDLARRAGILVEWQDFAGENKTVGADVLRRVLKALGLPADTNRELSASRRSLGRRNTLESLPPLVTAVAGRPTRLEISSTDPMNAELHLERGGSRGITLQPARGRLRIPPIMESGYHRLSIGNREIILAVAPSRCRSIDDIVPDARLWGVTTQVYGLVRPNDFGIGDLGGVVDLARAAGERGADALTLSPIHALYAANPEHYGPYAPSNRLFLNPLHAAPDLIFGQEAWHRAQVESGETTSLIDWVAASNTKYAMLRNLFARFLDGPDWDGPLGADFARFRADGGQMLFDHACFETLNAKFLSKGTWHNWPADLQGPTNPAISLFARMNDEEILFHQFLQWIADRSLAAAQAAARESGMRIGLIEDMPVGVDPAGSHAWSRPEDLLLGLTVGAPPDLLSPLGQNWGLTSFSPRALEATGFAAFIATLRAAMRHAGGIRVDHAIGLARLWLVPEGSSAADGAYLSYPLNDLLRLLALESVRHNAVVIAEDLGTVPAGFQRLLEQHGIHGMRVLWFEREGELGFIPPQNWDGSAIATTTTHDLATVSGWWRGADIDARYKTGRLGEDANPEQLKAERATERTNLWDTFVHEQLADGTAPKPEETQPVVDAAISMVVKTSLPLSLIPLEDLLGQVEQPNLPGTVKEYPNWRRRLPVEAGAVMDMEDVARRVELIAKERPRQ